MRIGRHRSPWFISRAALATFAIVVQTLLPLVIAADIVAAASAPPICHVPSPDEQKNQKPNPVNSCPICVALAASAAITTPATPALPLPRLSDTAAPVVSAQAAPDIHFATPYRSRAPPIA